MKVAKKPLKKKHIISQDQKTKFRRTAAWKKFRNKVKASQKYDPITGKPLSNTFNLHHLDLNPDHYTDISNEDKFIGLNSTSHELVHFCFGDSRTKKNWRQIILNLIRICKLMEKYN